MILYEKCFKKVSCWWLLLLFGICESVLQCEESPKTGEIKPHIVIIVADDLGFADVSVHGSNEIPTPNIDTLGIMGIQLNNLYGAPQCTPSRAAFMTGKYQSNLGMQHEVIFSDNPYGLGLNENTIAEYMRCGGYKTHLYGKWHLGFYEKRYTPTFRGFDSHFGYLGPQIDYYNHSYTWKNYSNGYDFRSNLTSESDYVGRYATDLLTVRAIAAIEIHDKSQPMFLMVTHLAVHAANDYELLQAPEDEMEKFNYIRDKDRRTYAAMVSKLDQNVGRVISALDRNGMLDNSIILFMSDNGAQTVGAGANHGSNYPLRGQKGHVWEGGVRSAAAIFSPLLKRRQRISNQMIHMTDWLPTFASIAGVKVNDQIDGFNVWDALSNDLPSPRKDLLVHHDDATPFMAYIKDHFKILSGTVSNGTFDRWLSEPPQPFQQNITFAETYSDSILSSAVGQALLKYTRTTKFNPRNFGHSGSISRFEIDELRKKAKMTCNGYTPPPKMSAKACDLLTSPCLFDIHNDPCETTNLANQMPEIVIELQAKLDYYGSIAIPIRNRPADPRCDPANFGGVWTWWYDEISSQNINNSLSPLKETIQTETFTTTVTTENIQSNSIEVEETTFTFTTVLKTYIFGI